MRDTGKKETVCEPMKLVSFPCHIDNEQMTGSGSMSVGRSSLIPKVILPWQRPPKAHVWIRADGSREGSKIQEAPRSLTTITSRPRQTTARAVSVTLKILCSKEDRLKMEWQILRIAFLNLP
jgi:hypothetical protein